MTWLPRSLRGWAEFVGAVVLIGGGIGGLLAWMGARVVGPADGVARVQEEVDLQRLRLNDLADLQDRRAIIMDSVHKMIFADLRGIVRISCIKSPDAAYQAGLDCSR